MLIKTFELPNDQIGLQVFITNIKIISEYKNKQKTKNISQNKNQLYTSTDLFWIQKYQHSSPPLILK